MKRVGGAWCTPARNILLRDRIERFFVRKKGDEFGAIHTAPRVRGAKDALAPAFVIAPATWRRRD
ncbi:hypothetical protein [Cupriavidus sp. RAF12]|uniref:hypothetical protein n=1 Tax=Cupriavidus sp. RAF12 TaxID=3233050 RepID=UPI003F91E738